MDSTFVNAVEARAKGGPAFSQEGLDLVKTFESFIPNAYYDLNNKKKKGKLTVGYGFTKYDIPNLKEGYTIDKAYAEQLLPSLIDRKYGPAVLESVQVPLNDNQFSALTSFAYNVGPTAFKNSTLLKKLNNGDLEGAASEFLKWTKAGGKEQRGLVTRRKAETALFKGDTQELGRILEKQKFGGGFSSNDMEQLLPAPSGIDLTGQNLMENAGPVPAQLFPGVDKSEFETPLTLSPAPDVPDEEAQTPEMKGALAAEKIGENWENQVEEKAKAEPPNEALKSPAEFAQEFYNQIAEQEKKQKEEQEAEPEIASNVLFGGGASTLASGLPTVKTQRIGRFFKKG